VLMAHSSSRPSRAPDVTTVSGASVLIVGCWCWCDAACSLPMTTTVGSGVCEGDKRDGEREMRVIDAGG
jgi:hypothetical protein